MNSQRRQFNDLVRTLLCQNPTYTIEECEQLAEDLLLRRSVGIADEETPVSLWSHLDPVKGPAER